MLTAENAFRDFLSRSGVVEHVADIYGRLSVLEYIVAHVMRAAACQTSSPDEFLNGIREQLVDKLANLPPEARPAAEKLADSMFGQCAAYIREYDLVLSKKAD